MACGTLEMTIRSVARGSAGRRQIRDIEQHAGFKVLNERLSVFGRRSSGCPFGRSIPEGRADCSGMQAMRIVWRC